MRSLFVFALVLALNGGVSAAGGGDGFEQAWYYTVFDPSKPNAARLGIQYYVRNGSYGSPILYGTAGRVNVEDIKSNYPLAADQADTFDRATVVYVEQRYFGNSFNGRVPTSIDDFAQLTLDNVVNDHVGLIRQLSSTYGTNSFLVFGGGHGGLIAGYVANKLANDPKLNVLGWSSSAPLKYLRRSDVSVVATQLKEIGTRFKEQVSTAPGCTLSQDDVATKLQKFFSDLRTLQDNTNIKQARLNPENIAVASGSPLTASVDLQKLAIFFRNALIALGFDNKPYTSTGAANTLRFTELCNWLNEYPATGANGITQLRTKALTDIIQPGSDPVYWDFTQSSLGNGKWDPNGAAAAYQDCTSYQILYCVDSDPAKKDPFTNSQPVNSQACQTDSDYDAFVRADCQALFTVGTTTPSPSFPLNTPKSTEYPTLLNKHVIQTLDDGSIFSKQNFDSDQDKGQYAYSYRVDGFDQIEFDKPRTCDNDRLRSIRYQILRAFGCLGGFVDTTDPDVCDTNKIFDGSKSNTPPVATTCPYDPTAKFPWGFTPDVTFNGRSTSVSPTSVGSTVSGPSSPSSPSTATQRTTTTTKGTGGVTPLVSLICGVFMISLAQLLKA